MNIFSSEKEKEKFINKIIFDLYLKIETVLFDKMGKKESSNNEEIS